MYPNSKAYILLLTVFVFNVFGQAESQKIEITTNKGCKYVEFVLPERAEVRKKSTVTWTGVCAGKYISGNGSLTIKAIDGQIQIFNVQYQNGLENGEGFSTSEGPKGKQKFEGIWSGALKLVEY